MISKCQRIVYSETARNILIWSYFRFKTLLVSKTREYSGCRVITCDEEYTTKTNSECGFLHYNIGVSKKFKCPQYHQESDNDFN